MIEVAMGVLVQDKKVLITQRTAEKTFPGRWEFPGGKIESGETPKIALIRELKEEIGIQVLSCHYLFNHQQNDLHHQVNLSIWQVVRWAGEIQSVENQAFSWVFLTDIENYPLLPGTQALITTLQASLCKTQQN